MATNSLFSTMLNQKAGQGLKVPKPGKAPGIGFNPQKAMQVQPPPGAAQFAYLNGSLYRHPLENRGKDLASGVWPKALSMASKPSKGGY